GARRAGADSLMRSPRAVRFLLLSSFVATLIWACSTKEDQVATSTGSGAGSSASSGGGGGLHFDGGSGGSSTNGCSGDLRDVLDPSGNVIKTCPPDQGCLDGACVAACDAANGSHSTLGCSYYAVEYPLPAGDASDPNGFRGPCFAAVVVNQWP